MDERRLAKAMLSVERLELIELLLMEDVDIKQETIRAGSKDVHMFPLSFAQQRLWFLDHLKPGNFVYNEAVAVRLCGKLHLKSLEQSLNEIIKRHESLRTRFTVVKGQPVQVIDPPQPVHLASHNLMSLSSAEQIAKIQALATKETQIPFYLSEGPLLRVLLLYLDKDTTVVLLTMHHIVSDGWSMGIFVKELAVLYRAYLQGGTSPLADLPIQYSDYALWQRQWLQGEVLDEHLAYWKTQLQALPSLQLPLDHARPAVQRFRGATHFFQLPTSLLPGLKRLGREEGATLFMVLMASFKILLYSYSGQQDVVVGTDVANRNRLETEALIGFFVNQLVLRTSLTGNPTVREVVRRVREVALQAYGHQDLPFDRLVEALNPERDLSQTPLFQVKFVLQNAPMPPLELPELTLELMDIDRGIAKFDLLCNIWETVNGLSGALDYNTDLFDETTIVLMLGHFEALLQRIVTSLDTDVHIDMLTEMLKSVDNERRVKRYQERRSANLQKLGRLKSSKSGVSTV